MQTTTATTERDLYASLWRGDYRPSKTSRYVAAYICRTFPAEWTLLDVGCGDGAVVAALRDSGRECWGVDITLAATGAADHLVEAPAWDMPFKDGQFDVVFSSDVLEHLPCDLVSDTFREMARVASKAQFHVIATFPHEIGGQVLHKTVAPIDWWKFRAARASAGVETTLFDRTEFLLMAKAAKCFPI